MKDLTGFEPVTSRYRRDAVINQLSYEAIDVGSWSFVHVGSKSAKT